MKKKIVLSFLLSLSLTLPLFSQSGEDTPISFSSFQGGLNTKTSPLLLNESQSPDCQNVWFDNTDVLSKRSGYNVYCQLPATGTVLGSFEYTRSSGEKWLIVQISSTVYGTKDNGLTWATIQSNLSIINPCNYAQYLNQVWATNGFDNVFTFDGSSTTGYEFIPKGKYITIHYDTIFLANTPDNASAVYFNDVYYSPSDSKSWQGVNQFNIGQNDGDVITGINSYRGNLIVFKNASTWGILGYGNDMSLYKYSNLYGSVSQQSVQEYKNELLFLSKQGLCAFNNGNIKQIDRTIDDITKNAKVIKGTAVKKEWIQTELSDFVLGISSNVDIYKNYGQISIPTGNLISETKSTLKGTTPSWQGVTYTGGAARYIDSNEIDLNPRNYYQIEGISINLSRTGAVNLNTEVTLKLYDTNNLLLGATSQLCLLGDHDWYTFFSSWTIKNTDKIRAELWINSGANSTYAFQYLHYISSILYSLRNGNTVNWKMDLQYNYRVSPSTYGYFISQKYDAGGNINQWKYFIASSAGSSLSYYVRYATFSASSIFTGDTAGWASITNGSLIQATTSQRFIQWRADFNNPNQILYSVTLQYYEGASDYQNCSSAFFNNRYYISFSTINVTNDVNIVMDNNGAYTQWDLPAGVFIPYNNNLYFSKNNDYQLYQMFQGYNDNGVAINGYWKSKYFDMGSNQDKKITKIGITTKGSGNLLVGYKANYDTAFSTITIPLTSSETNYVYNLPESINRAQYWQTLLQNNTVGGWFDVVRFDVYFIGYPLRVR